MDPENVPAKFEVRIRAVRTGRAYRPWLSRNNPLIKWAHLF